MVRLTILVDFLANTQTVCLSYARTISGRVQESVVRSTHQLPVQMALGSHRPVLRVWRRTGQSLILGTVTDYQPSVAPIYGHLLGLTMLRGCPLDW